MTIEEAKAEIKTSIDELYENGKRHAIFVRNNGELVIEGLRMALEILNQVEPKSKTGKWIKNPEYIGDEISGFIDNHFSCSECKKEAEINSWGFYTLSDFCPNCGADMREGT